MNVGQVMIGACMIVVFGGLSPFALKIGKFFENKNREFNDVIAPSFGGSLGRGARWVPVVIFPVFAVFGLVLLIASL